MAGAVFIKEIRRVWQHCTLIVRRHTGVEIHRVVGGKIVEGWRKWDRMDVMQQLGVTDIALYRADA